MKNEGSWRDFKMTNSRNWKSRSITNHYRVMSSMRNNTLNISGGGSHVIICTCVREPSFIYGISRLNIKKGLILFSLFICGTTSICFVIETSTPKTSDTSHLAISNIWPTAFTGRRFECTYSRCATCRASTSIKGSFEPLLVIGATSTSSC